MNNPTHYRTIAGNGLAEFKDRGSKFLAYAFPMDDIATFKLRLEEVKKEHPKATHHCFAYRIGTDKDQFRVSDDGEPSGTAGKPILCQIDSNGLTNVLIIVVRYFGGSLLGVPGLINAYRSSAAAVLEKTPSITKEISVAYRLEFEYTILNEVMNVLKQSQLPIRDKDIGLFCSVTVSIPVQLEEMIVNKLQLLQGCTCNRL